MPMMTSRQRDDVSSPPVLGRRGFLGVLGGSAAALSACTVGNMDDLPVFNTVWPERAAQLKTTGIYTAAAPGMWAGKEATHVPSVTIAADRLATVSCTHGVAEGHWLSTLWVEDQNGNVIHMAEFLGRGPESSAASTSFRVPAGVTSLVAYSHCNLHDAWATVPVKVG